MDIRYKDEEDEERYQPQADLGKVRLNFSRSLSGAAGCFARDHVSLRIFFRLKLPKLDALKEKKGFNGLVARKPNGVEKKIESNVRVFRISPSPKYNDLIVSVSVIVAVPD